MDNEISFHMFCYYLVSQLRLLLFGFTVDGSYGAIILLRLLLRVGFVEKA